MAQKSVQFMWSAFDERQFPMATLPEIAFAGRSNVGKSSLLNALMGQRQLARVSSTPGRTRSVNFFMVERRFLVADLPGYGFARVPGHLKQAWKQLIEGYLQDRPSIAGVALLVDCRHKPQAMDLKLAEYLRQVEVPFLLVATKADKLTERQLELAVEGLASGFEVPIDMVMPVSSVSGAGIKDLWSQIYRAVDEREAWLKGEQMWGIPSLKAPGIEKEKKKRPVSDDGETPKPRRKKLTPLHRDWYKPREARRKPKAKSTSTAKKNKGGGRRRGR